MDKLFIGQIVHSLGPENLELIPNGALGVAHDGSILFVGKGSAASVQSEHGTAKSVIHLQNHQFLFPGFIDTHIHAPQYPNAGIFGKSTLLDWLETYTFPLEGKFKDLKIAEEVYTRVVNRGLHCGTSTASYYGTVHTPATVELAKVCLKLGQRALVGRVCMERFAPDNLVNASDKDDEILIEELAKLDARGDMVRPCLTPRFAPSCTEKSMSKLGELAHKHKLPIQTHISENDKEIAWVAELFPEAESYADVYRRCNLLTDRTILAHAVHLTDKEIEMVLDHNCGVSHCPISNSSIASGIAPIKKYLTKMDKVGLGTDVSGGSSISVLENARHALLYSRLLSQVNDDADIRLSVGEALYLSTLGGAKVCSIDEKVGSFAKGKRFDAQIIDVTAKGSPIDLFEWAVPKDPEACLEYLVNKWVYIGDDRNTVKVWVDGKLVVEK